MEKYIYFMQEPPSPKPLTVWRVCNINSTDGEPLPEGIPCLLNVNYALELQGPWGGAHAYINRS